MAQNSFALMTNLGRAKEAAAIANGTAVVITHIAIGDGTTVPSGGETTLYHEIARKTVSGHGTVSGAANVAYFDIFLAAAEGPYTIREAGLIDQDGALIAIARYDPPINKPIPSSGQTVEGTVRLEVAFSNIANVTIVVDPTFKVPMQRLTRLPWLPVLSMTVTTPPASPVLGDIYLVPSGATGAWTGQGGKIAEYTAAGWGMITPPNGHGIGLPDGRVFERINGAYVEFLASRDWVNNRKTPIGQLNALPWVAVKSITQTAPPATPAEGDIYIIPSGATGAWAGKTGQVAEWSEAAWRYLAPPNGHGVSLPDGRVFERINGVYVEFLASRDWVNNRKTPIGQLNALPWISVNSITQTAPPAAPAEGDTYIIPSGATGAWAGKAGQVAEWSEAAWRYSVPSNGHGISLPDGRVFERINGTYVEFLASREWVNSRQTPVTQLKALPWLPVKSVTITAPPAIPSDGDIYIVPTGATGAWAGKTGQVAEWSEAAWRFSPTSDGHGVSLPDGRIFERVGGVYIEKVAIDAQSGKWSFAIAAGTATALTVNLNPVPVSYVAGMVINVVVPSDCQGPSTLSVNGLPAKQIVRASNQAAVTAKDWRASGIATFVYDGTKFQFLTANNLPSPLNRIENPAAAVINLTPAALGGMFYGNNARTTTYNLPKASDFGVGYIGFLNNLNQSVIINSASSPASSDKFQFPNNPLLATVTLEYKSWLVLFSDGNNWLIFSADPSINASLAQSLAPAGRKKHDGGLIEQWGTTVITIGSNGYGTIFFPEPFPNQVFTVVAGSAMADTPLGQKSVSVFQDINKNSFNIYFDAPNTPVRINWTARGH